MTLEDPTLLSNPSHTTASGVVYWFTGLAGAGKSTLAGHFAERLRALGRPAVLLDGDELRATLFPNAGYEPEERLDLALRYSRLCKVLSDQGFDVVCATISLFPQVWEQNREILSAYREVLVHAPRAVLRDRKPSVYLRSAHEHVVGERDWIPRPPRADLSVENDGSRGPEAIVDELVAKLVPTDQVSNLRLE